MEESTYHFYVAGAEYRVAAAKRLSQMGSLNLGVMAAAACRRARDALRARRHLVSAQASYARLDSRFFADTHMARDADGRS